jgi:hypothetical protein
LPDEGFVLVGSAAVRTSSDGFVATSIPAFSVWLGFGMVDSPVSCHDLGIRKKKKRERILTSSSPEDSNSSTPVSSVSDSMILLD